jgi:hypothetical protein
VHVLLVFWMKSVSFHWLPTFFIGSVSRYGGGGLCVGAVIADPVFTSYLMKGSDELASGQFVKNTKLLDTTDWTVTRGDAGVPR